VVSLEVLPEGQIQSPKRFLTCFMTVSSSLFLPKMIKILTAFVVIQLVMQFAFCFLKQLA